MTERTAYRLSEVRAALGISRSTLYRWIEDGKIKVTRVCGQPFVMREDHPAPPVLTRLDEMTSGELAGRTDSRPRVTDASPNPSPYLSVRSNETE